LRIYIVVYIVIPAYNEEGNIATLVEQIVSVATAHDFAYRIVIVDDGSTDATPQIIEGLASHYAVVSLKNTPNMGLGRTMAKGLHKAVDISGPSDVIVTLDGDATHDPVYIPQMIDRIHEGYDIVIASRFAPGGTERGLSSFRKFLSRGSGLLLKVFFPTDGLRDYTCGYRAFRASIVRQGFDSFGDDFIKENGFSVTPEILLKLRALGAQVSEVGFVLKYDQKVGKSKIRIARTITQYLRMIASLKLAGLQGRPPAPLPQDHGADGYRRKAG
jgi:dolichol-phosphate mannosyltransferase